MAGNWIAMRTDLADDPAVIQLADRLGLDEFAVVGRLHRLWSWADSQLRDGNAPGVTPAWLDRYMHTPGFADALVSAGWLTVRDGASGGLTFPQFDRWNFKSAKKRMLGKQRVARHREAIKRGESSVQPCNADSVTEELPQYNTEQKKKEVPHTPAPRGPGVSPPSASKAPNRRRKPDPEPHPLFDGFWQAFPRKVAKPAAVKAFTALSPDAAVLSLMLAAIARQRASEQWQRDGGQYIPHPATWLRQRRWEDVTDAAPPPPTAPKYTDPKAAGLL